jgi:hypothetical protein
VIDSVADALMDMSPDFSVGTARGAASWQDARSLIAALLDDRDQRSGWINAMNGERALMLDSKAIYADAAIEKLTQLRLVRTLDDATALRQAGLLATYPQALDALASSTNRWKTRSWIKDSTTMFLPSEMRAMQACFRVLTDRRLAATAVALRCYQLDEGNLPASLDPLVPRYLPATPIDPLSKGATMLCYRPEKTNPLLYSVGTNAVDDNGSFALTKALPTGAAPERWDSRDAVTPLLIRQPRAATRPATN